MYNTYDDFQRNDDDIYNNQVKMGDSPFAPKTTPQTQNAPQPQQQRTPFNEQTAVAAWSGLDPTANNFGTFLDRLTQQGYSVERGKGGQSSDFATIDGKGYDFLRDVGGQNAAWQLHDPSSFEPGGANYNPAAAAMAAGQGGANGSMSMSSSSNNGITSAQSDELFQMLMGRAKQGLNVSRNDPTIRAQADAYSANEERSKRNYLGDLAEKAGPLANLRGEERLANERVGQRTGGFEAELMGRELTARRTEIAQALQGLQGFISGDKQMALQRELAMLDNAIRQQQLGLQGQQMGMQNDQFLRQLGLNEWDRQNYWDSLRSGYLG